MLADLARLRVHRDVKFVVLVLRIGELADRIDILPRACVERILGVRDGRGGIFGVEADEERLAATESCRTLACWPPPSDS